MDRKMCEKKKINMLQAALGAVLYLWIIWKLVPLVYGIIDDRSMMEIVSGQYLGHPDAHAIFLGYWYALFLTGLYRLLPNVDWYALCYLLLQGVCLGLVLYRVLSRTEDRRKRLLSGGLVLLFAAAFGASATAQLTFTTTAAWIGITVIFWYVTAEKVVFGDWLLLTILCFLTEQVRSSVFFMILPVCAVLWLFRAGSERESGGWHGWIPAAVIGVLLVSGAGKVCGYGSADWRAYEAYNQNRSQVFDYADYTFPRYEDATEFYHSMGIYSKSRAKTLFHYNYTADEQITPEFFGNYIAAYEKAFPSGLTPAKKVLLSGKDYIKGIFSGRFHATHLLALLLYGGLILWYIRGREWKACWRVLCVAGIQGLLWVYLLYEGRMPERVLYSMNLMLLVTVVLLWLEAWKELPVSEKGRRMAVLAGLLVLGVLAFSRIGEVRRQNLEMSHRNEDIIALKEYCMEHPENFYFNDVTSLAFTTYNVHLWQAKPYEMNYMSLGDWMSYSPVWQEKLRQQGISSVKQALYERENVYLICSFDKGLEYLVSLYEDVECTEVEKIPGFKIYRLQLL